MSSTSPSHASLSASFAELERPAAHTTGQHRTQIAPASGIASQPVHRRAARVRLSTGITLEYVSQGDTSGAPVVLLHGYTDSCESYAPVLPHLPPTVRAFAPSLRGHGRSDRPPRGYAMRDMACDVAAFMDALGLHSATIVGHSMGARVALRTAVDYPDRVRAVMLIGAFAPGLPNACLDEFEAAVSTLVDPVPESFAREFQEGTIGQPVPRTFVNTMIGESLHLPAATWQAALAGFLADDVSEALPRLRVPVQCVWGAKDTYVPRRDQDALLAAIPGATLRVYATAGHAVHWEEPARVAGDLMTLLAANTPAMDGRP